MSYLLVTNPNLLCWTTESEHAVYCFH